MQSLYFYIHVVANVLLYVSFLQKLGAKVNIFCIYYHIFMNWYVYLEAGT